MRHPQFSFKTLLWLMAVVAAFCSFGLPIWRWAQSSWLKPQEFSELRAFLEPPGSNTFTPAFAAIGLVTGSLAILTSIRWRNSRADPTRLAKGLPDAQAPHSFLPQK